MQLFIKRGTFVKYSAGTIWYRSNGWTDGRIDDGNRNRPRGSGVSRVRAIHKTLLFYLVMDGEFKAGLHHGPCIRTMEDGLLPWSYMMVQLSWSDFFQKKINLQSFWDPH